MGNISVSEARNELLAHVEEINVGHQVSQLLQEIFDDSVTSIKKSYHVIDENGVLRKRERWYESVEDAFKNKVRDEILNQLGVI